MKMCKVTPPNHYVKISQELAKDSRLSWKARGIFLYLWSNHKTWEYHAEEVAKHAPDGKDSLQSGINELEKYGYLQRKQRRGKGKFAGYMWFIYYVSATNRPDDSVLNPTRRQHRHLTGNGKSVDGKTVYGKPATNKKQLKLEKRDPTKTKSRGQILTRIQAYWGIPNIFLDDTCNVIDKWLDKYPVSTIIKTVNATNDRQLKQGKIRRPINYINVVLHDHDKRNAQPKPPHHNENSFNDVVNKEKQHEAKLVERFRKRRAN